MIEAKKSYSLEIIADAVGNNPEEIMEMIQLFIDTLPPDLENLKKEANNANWLEVAKIAHKIKANIAMLQVKNALKKIREVETLSTEEKNAERILRLIEKIIVEMAEVFSSLKNELK